jgi:hypothetical protein
MPTKRLLARVNYDNQQYEIGDQIDIRDADLPQLESVGAVEDPPAEDPPADDSAPAAPRQSRRPKAAG